MQGTGRLDGLTMLVASELLLFSPSGLFSEQAEPNPVCRALSGGCAGASGHTNDSGEDACSLRCPADTLRRESYGTGILHSLTPTLLLRLERQPVASV